MPQGMPTTDVFGIFKFWMQHAPIPRLILEVERRNWPYPWAFPALGPGYGVANSGSRSGIPRGSSKPDITGVIIRPPKQ